MVLLVDRPAAWYVAVRGGGGVAQGDAGRIIPALTPAWALADSLVFGEPLWTPAPDDLYVDDVPAGDFVRAYNALCEVASASAEGAEDVRRGAALIDVYDRIYANQHARPVPQAQRRAGMR
ncbi:MAG: hypothetical protein KGL02_08970 [Acidobacteriota bacterium]|nr:hypothetical protein [Acidobacteriota bacterium]